MELEVKVTVVPEQIVVARVLIVIDGVSGCDALITTEFDVAFVGLTQLALEVIRRVTISPFVNVLDE